MISTTGFGTVDFAVWPLAARVILLFLMFTGACAGSTAGGFKIARVALLTKSAGSEVQRQIKPRHLRPTYFEGHHVTEKMISSVAHYFMLYAICFAVLVFLVSIDSPDIETAIGAVSATFNNIGPGLSAVGPTQNYADFTPFSKLCLSFGMIAGRLEILPVLIFFSPHTWKRA